MLQHQQLSGYSFLHFIKISKALFQTLAVLFISIVYMLLQEPKDEKLALYSCCIDIKQKYLFKNGVEEIYVINLTRPFLCRNAEKIKCDNVSVCVILGILRGKVSFKCCDQQLLLPALPLTCCLQRRGRSQWGNS